MNGIVNTDEEEKGGDNMVGEEGPNEQTITGKQGYPRNEEFNARKGEDNYGFLFGNNKLQFDNAMVSSQTNNAAASLALDQAVAFQQKANDLYLGQMDAREKANVRAVDQYVAQSGSEHNQRMEHEDESEQHQRDNDRKTMQELYGLSAEDSVALVPVLSALLDIVSKKKVEK